MTVHHRFSNAPSLQTQHPILYSHMNHGGGVAPTISTPPNRMALASGPGKQGYPNNVLHNAIGHPGEYMEFLF